MKFQIELQLPKGGREAVCDQISLALMFSGIRVHRGKWRVTFESIPVDEKADNPIPEVKS